MLCNRCNGEFFQTLAVDMPVTLKDRCIHIKTEAEVCCTCAEVNMTIVQRNELFTKVKEYKFKKGLK